MVQDPAFISVTVVPETVQTPGVEALRLTGSPEEAVALIVNGESLRVLSAIAGKSIVWLFWLIGKVR